MTNPSRLDLEELVQRLKDYLRSYAGSRKQDVARGAEAPELAAVRVEKYGFGVAQTAKLTADQLDAPAEPGGLDQSSRVSKSIPTWPRIARSVGRLGRLEFRTFEGRSRRSVTGSLRYTRVARVPLAAERTCRHL